MGTYNQIATITVKENNSALLDRIDDNVAFALALGRLDRLPKKRQQLIKSILSDITKAREKGLLEEDRAGYFCHNNIKYNPKTGVLVLNACRANPNDYGYTKDYAIVFTKPVKSMTEDEIRNANFRPEIKIAEKKNRNPIPESAYSITKYINAAHYLIKMAKVKKDGSSYFSLATWTDEDINLIRNTPAIVYILIARFMGSAMKSIVNCTADFPRWLGKEKPKEFLKRIIGCAQAQEESKVNVMPKDLHGDRCSLGYELQKVRDIYHAILQMFDTTSGHDVKAEDGFNGCRGTTDSSNTRYARNNGWITRDDPAYNFSEFDDTTFFTLDTVKIPTNDSIERLKEVIADLDLKNSTHWGATSDNAKTILDVIKEADIQYNDVKFTPVCNMRTYPQFDDFSDYNYIHPEKNPDTSKYRNEDITTESYALVGIGLKKDIETEYDVLATIASQNKYLNDFLTRTGVLLNGTKPSFKLDNEVCKDTLADLLTDDEITEALKDIISRSEAQQGELVRPEYNAEIRDKTWYFERAVSENEPRDPENSWSWFVPLFTIDLDNAEELADFCEHVRQRAFKKDYVTSGVCYRYTADRDVIAFKHAIKTIYDYKPTDNDDDFIKIKHYSNNPGDIIDGDFKEID